MATLEQFVDQFSPLSEAAEGELLRDLRMKFVAKGDFLLRQGERCGHLYFVNVGLLKIFSLNGDKEVVMRFFPENVLFTVFDSYASQAPSRFSILALEPTTVTLVSRERMEALCQAHHSVETLFRKLALVATAKMTRRIAEMLEDDAAQRYRRFRENNPELMQRVSLGELAKYLGITQQSLSRIRAQH